MLGRIRAWLCAAVMMLGLSLLSSCAPATNVASPHAQSISADDLAYAQAITRRIADDQQVQAILLAHHDAQTRGVGLLIDSNGYVDHAFMVRAKADVALDTELLNYLVNINFGAFPADITRPQFYFLVPVHPVTTAAQPMPAGFKAGQIVLYQPNQILQDRVQSPTVLAAYIRSIDLTAATIFNEIPAQPGLDAAIVVGVKPGGLSRAWIVSHHGRLPAPVIDRLTKAIEAIPPIQVKDGPIIFATIFSVWGGGPPITNAANPAPLPREWVQSIPKGSNVIVPDGIFARLWP